MALLSKNADFVLIVQVLSLLVISGFGRGDDSHHVNVEDTIVDHEVVGDFELRVLRVDGGVNTKTSLSFDWGKPHKFMPATVNASFTFSDRKFVLQMNRKKVFSDKYIETEIDIDIDTNTVHVGDLRVRRTLTKPPTRADCFYHGKVVGDANSIVAMSLCDGVYVSVHTNGGESFELRPSKREPGKQVAFYVRDVHGSSSAPNEQTHCSVEHDDDDNRIKLPRNLMHTLNQSVAEHEHDHDHESLSLNTHNTHKTKRALCVKTVDVVVINDHSLYAVEGEDTETFAAHVMSLVAAKYQAAPFACTYNVEILGQLTFRHGTPAAIQEPKCAGSNTEYDNEILYPSVGTWVSTWESELEDIFGAEIDNVVYLTGRNFCGNVVGFAGVGTMCQSKPAHSINQAASRSATRVALTVTHEMGHNFGLKHVSESESIMSAVSNVSLSFDDTGWSSTSVTFIDAVESQYTCLLNNIDPQSQTCGNGVIEGTEQCDPGFHGDVDHDPCCDDTCQLSVGCECSATDVCCGSDGKYKTAGTVCRGSQDSECDVAEVCSGTSSDCQADVFEIPGTECGIDGNSRCYQGDCHAPLDDSICTATFPTFCESLKHLCRDSCHNETSQCQTFFNWAPDGTPCGENKQCVSLAVEQGGSTCLPSIQFPYCGNGIVDDGEDCDVGDGEQDSCCSSTCTFEPGCECANNDECCDNGVISSSQTVCRVALDASCDSEETCDGSSSLCPVDIREDDLVLCSEGGDVCRSGVCEQKVPCYNKVGTVLTLSGTPYDCVGLYELMSPTLDMCTHFHDSIDRAMLANCPKQCGCPTVCEDVGTTFTNGGVEIPCADMFLYSNLKCDGIPQESDVNLRARYVELTRRCPVTCGVCSPDGVTTTAATTTPIATTLAATTTPIATTLAAITTPIATTLAATTPVATTLAATTTPVTTTPAATTTLVATTAAVTTPIATTPAATCPSNCGSVDNGGGTCTADLQFCTSCNDKKVLLKEGRTNGEAYGTCLASIACKASKVNTEGNHFAKSCKCSDSNCHYCVIKPEGETCRRCKAGSYLHNNQCITTCPSDLTSVGTRLIGRECLPPFECKSGRSIGLEETRTCKCTDPSNAKADCARCFFKAGEHGEHCTKCSEGKFLHLDTHTCNDDCTGQQGVTAYSVGAIGASCRDPFICVNGLDEGGAKCKCSKALRPNCHTCEWEVGDVNKCLVCTNRKFLKDGLCVTKSDCAPLSIVDNGITGSECV